MKLDEERFELNLTYFNPKLKEILDKHFKLKKKNLHIKAKLNDDYETEFDVLTVGKNNLGEYTLIEDIKPYLDNIKLFD